MPAPTPKSDLTRLAYEASKKSQAEAKRLNHPEAEPPRPPWPQVRPRAVGEPASDVAAERARRKISSRIANIKATDRYKSGSIAPPKV